MTKNECRIWPQQILVCSYINGFFLVCFPLILRKLWDESSTTHGAQVCGHAFACVKASCLQQCHCSYEVDSFQSFIVTLRSTETALKVVIVFVPFYKVWFNTVCEHIVAFGCKRRHKGSKQSRSPYNHLKALQVCFSFANTSVSDYFALIQRGCSLNINLFNIVSALWRLFSWAPR